MIKKVLIANRGEITCRIIETAQRMGVSCVAVHSDVDAGARHVVLADQAVSLGGATPAESYLRGDALIAAARDSGAQAIHPGYGFLSEREEFPRVLEKNGITFIGPNPAAIAAMGAFSVAAMQAKPGGISLT